MIEKVLPVMGNCECFMSISENYPNIKNIEFIEFIPILSKYQLNENKWDVSDKHNFSVMAWLDGNTLYISGNGPILANEDCAKLFFGYMEVEKICFNDLFDTRNLQDASEMFANCKSLKYIDISKWNTESLKKFHRLFMGCKSLKEIGFFRWNTQYLQDAGMVFYGCENLEKVITSSEKVFNEIDDKSDVNELSKNENELDKMNDFLDFVEIMLDDGWNINEIKEVFNKRGFYTVYENYDDFDKRDFIKGYDIFVDPKFGSITEICKLDTINIYALDYGYEGFKTDKEASLQAERDGIKIAWDIMDKIVDLFGEEHYILDTKRNRCLIDYFLK